MPSRLTRAALAAAVAVVLLSGSGTTLAGWGDAERRDVAVVVAGELSVTAQGTTTVVLRPGAAAPLPADTPLVPGDVVRLTSTVRVTARGDLLTGTLALDLGGVHGTPVATVATDLPPTGTHRWAVTPDDDGALVTAVVELAVPTTTDGRPAAADRSNWWGSDLQHVTLDPGALRWTITQDPS